MKRGKKMPRATTHERRVASISEAITYGRAKLQGGRFSRDIIYALIKRKKITAYRHMGRNVLIDLDSIDRYINTLPIAEFPTRNHAPGNDVEGRK